MALPVIELQNVSINFDDAGTASSLFTDLCLQIVPESSIVIIGPSGQGKSVLLKLMSGLLAPSSGEVLIKGRNLQKLDGDERQKLLCGMGMLFQKNALFDSMTCGENIAFPLREVTGLSESEIEKTVNEFLEAVGILHAKQLFPGQISGGMQKRLGIARALALNPDLIFYDDPTAGLDPITSKKIIELILNLKQRNRATVISVTNDMNRAFQLTQQPNDRIWMVFKQQVLDAGNAQTARETSQVVIRQFMKGEASP